jgi:hypothetical protein
MITLFAYRAGCVGDTLAGHGWRRHLPGGRLGPRCVLGRAASSDRAESPTWRVPGSEKYGIPLGRKFWLSSCMLGIGVGLTMFALSFVLAFPSRSRREELSRIVIQGVVVRVRQLEAIEWTPQVRAFFEGQRECPQGDSNP